LKFQLHLLQFLQLNSLKSLLIKATARFRIFRCKRARSIERKARKRREIDKFINYRITGNSESITGSVIRSQLPVITGNGNYRLKPYNTHHNLTKMGKNSSRFF